MRIHRLVAALAAALFSPPLAAQQPAAADTAALPPAVAVRATEAPVLDGRDTDPVWRTAPATSQFLEFQPNEGKAPRYKTEFRVSYDDRNFYVFVRAFDPHPDSIMTALTRRDVRGPSDQLKVMIDAQHDRRSGFEFAVNPLGVKRDYAMYNDTDEDESWDGIWDVATRIDSLGWTAEFAIPFSQLRYSTRKEHTFGFAVWRDIERYKERTSWPLYSSKRGGTVSQLGILTGVRDIAPFRRLELIPYTVAKTSNIRMTGAPGGSGYAQSQRISAGADVKYGITPNLTLDATVNPDFGQVEADPSVVNLSAFETFLQERRPFFIEGTGLYSFNINCSIVNCSGEGLFYSRRIGRSPQLFGAYADAASPNVVPIIGAAKLTGRVGALNVGLLEAVTGRLGGMEDRTTEPRTSYTVLRAQQDLNNGETSIGAIATGVNRSLDEWTEQSLRRDAYVVGTNMRHRWGPSRFEATASLTRSLVRGSAASILRTQMHPVHLFQRADDDLRLDSARTSLSGDAEEFSFGKFGGNMVRFQTSYMRRSPGFESNDLGYLRRANQQSFANWMGFNWRKPTRFFRQLSGNLNAWGDWTADGLPTERALNTNWHMNLPNNMWVHGGTTASQLRGTFCDNCSRGGPAFRRSPYVNANIGVQGDDRKRIVPSLWVSGGRGDYGASHYLSIEPSLAWLPMSQLQLELSASFFTNTDDSQWLDNFTDSVRTHYTFAHLDQVTQSLGARASYTATPTLSFQLYVAPFISRGRFSNPRELSANPRADRYEDRYTPYTTPDGALDGFDALQVRSNSVLRWEFRPGSTLFAVWSHGRESEGLPFSDRPWRSEYRELMSLHPANTFLVKLAYFINGA